MADTNEKLLNGEGVAELWRLVKEEDAKKAPAYTYGTEDIEAGSASPYETGHLHFVIE